MIGLFKRKGNILESLDSDFLQYLDEKTTEYMNNVINKYWNEKTSALSQEKEKKLVNIGAFKSKIQRELRKGNK